MKVFYNGFNLYRQLPENVPLVEQFANKTVENLEDIEVNHTFAVLLVAGKLRFSGAKNEITCQWHSKIKKIASTEDTLLVLLENGEIFKYSENDFVKISQLAELEDGDFAVNIAAGSKLSVALTKNGFLYNIPNKLDFRNRDIVDFRLGREHCVILCRNGDVYTFGRGSRGQLGHGCLGDEIEPKFVDALGGIKIAAIAAGGWHSCALSADGDLYIWGWNGNGQIGLSTSEEESSEHISVMATPHVVDFELNVKSIACGSRHVVALMEDGRLFGCGWNKYKQLKNSLQENIYKMTYLHDFSKEKVIRVKCGPWNTLVLCEE